MALLTFVCSVSKKKNGTKVNKRKEGLGGRGEHSPRKHLAYEECRKARLDKSCYVSALLHAETNICPAACPPVCLFVLSVPETERKEEAEYNVKCSQV